MTINLNRRAFLLAAGASLGPAQSEFDLRRKGLLYSSAMHSEESVAGWKMEGPGEISFADGWMKM